MKKHPDKTMVSSNTDTTSNTDSSSPANNRWSFIKKSQEVLDLQEEGSSVADKLDQSDNLLEAEPNSKDSIVNRPSKA